MYAVFMCIHEWPHIGPRGFLASSHLRYILLAHIYYVLVCYTYFRRCWLIVAVPGLGLWIQIDGINFKYRNIKEVLRLIGVCICGQADGSFAICLAYAWHACNIYTIRWAFICIAYWVRKDRTVFVYALMAAFGTNFYMLNVMFNRIRV